MSQVHWTLRNGAMPNHSQSPLRSFVPRQSPIEWETRLFNETIMDIIMDHRSSLQFWCFQHLLPWLFLGRLVGLGWHRIDSSKYETISWRLIQMYILPHPDSDHHWGSFCEFARWSTMRQESRRRPRFLPSKRSGNPLPIADNAGYIPKINKK